jgi:hypothetical protein
MRELPDLPPVDDHEAKLELALIEEFLRSHGQDFVSLASLTDEQRERLLHDASLYASARLAEIEARAHYVGDLHRHE